MIDVLPQPKDSRYRFTVAEGCVAFLLTVAQNPAAAAIYNGWQIWKSVKLGLESDRAGCKGCYVYDRWY